MRKHYGSVRMVKHIMNAWQARWNEYQIFTDPKTRELLDYWE